MPLVPLRLPISEVLRRPSSMPTSARSIRPMPAAFWLKSANSGVLEHESICKALELAIECDQLNIGELATVWLLCRSLQMIQYRWKDRILGSTSNGTVDDESHFFLGVDPTRGNLCICTAFNIWPGEELHKEAQANKEQRKAWEERAFPPGQQGKVAATVVAAQRAVHRRPGPLRAFSGVDSFLFSCPTSSGSGLSGVWDAESWQAA